MTIAEKCQQMQDDNGFWSIYTEWPSQIKGENVTGTMSHIDFDALEQQVADLAAKVGKGFSTGDYVWTPPVNKFDGCTAMDEGYLRTA